MTRAQQEWKVISIHSSVKGTDMDKKSSTMRSTKSLHHKNRNKLHTQNKRYKNNCLLYKETVMEGGSYISEYEKGTEIIQKQQ